MCGELNVVDFGELDKILGHLAARGQVDLVERGLHVVLVEHVEQLLDVLGVEVDHADRQDLLALELLLEHRPQRQYELLGQVFLREYLVGQRQDERVDLIDADLLHYYLRKCLQFHFIFTLI